MGSPGPPEVQEKRINASIALEQERSRLILAQSTNQRLESVSTGDAAGAGVGQKARQRRGVFFFTACFNLLRL